MLALSIRQPWAWLIIHAGKDIENRTWYTKVRGRVLVHAAKGMTRQEWATGYDTARWHCNVPKELLDTGCDHDQLQRGGIIGSVEIVDCTKLSGSSWHAQGQWGFVLRNPQPLPFRPYKGALGFFEVTP